DRRRTTVPDGRLPVGVLPRQLDPDPATAAQQRPAVGLPGGERVLEPGPPERKREPEVDESRTADLDTRQPAMAVPEASGDGRGDGARSLRQLAAQHQGDVAGEVAEDRMPRRVHPEVGHRAGPEEPRFDRVAQRFTDERVNVRLHPGSRAKDTVRRTRRGPGEHPWPALYRRPPTASTGCNATRSLAHRWLRSARRCAPARASGALLLGLRPALRG